MDNLIWHDYMYMYEKTDTDINVISELNIEVLIFDDASANFSITKETMVSMILKNDDYKFTYYPNRYKSSDVPSIWFKLPKINDEEGLYFLYNTLMSMVVVNKSPTNILLKMINNRTYWDNKYKALLNKKHTLFYSDFITKIIPNEIILQLRKYETQ